MISMSNMDEMTLKQYESQLYNHWPLVGKWRSLRALQALVRHAIRGSAQATELLTKVVISPPDPELGILALKTLERMTHPDVIDAICRAWAASRNPELEALILTNQWVATAPLKVRLLTALRLSKLDIIIHSNAKMMPALVEVLLKEQDTALMDAARLILGKVEDPEAQESLCQLAIEKGSNLLRELVLEAGYLPGDPFHAALLYLLTDRWEAYESLDPDQLLMPYLRENASESLQQQVVVKLRQAKRPDLLAQIFGKSRPLRTLLDLEPQEWQDVYATLQEEERWSHLWLLAHWAPAVWGVRFVLTLAQANWLPATEEERELFTRLCSLAQRASDRPTRLNELTVNSMILQEHRDGVASLVVSSDGKYLASGGWDKDILIWQLPQGILIHILKGHPGKINTMATPPHSHFLASGSDWDHAIYLWELEQGTLHSTLKAHTNWIRALVTTPDGHLLASSSWDSTIRLWRLPSQESSDITLLKTLKGHTDDVTILAVSADGRFLASGGDDRTIHLWRLPDGARINVLELHTSKISAIAFTPDSNYLVTASWDRTVGIWRLPEGTLVEVMEEEVGRVTALAVSPNIEALMVATTTDADPEIRIWGLPDSGLLYNLAGHSKVISCLAFSPDGEILASGDWEGQIYLWHAQTGQRIKNLIGHTAQIHSLAFTPDGQYLISGAGYPDNSIRIWSSRLGLLSQQPVVTLDEMDLGWVERSLSLSSIKESKQIWLDIILTLAKLSQLPIHENLGRPPYRLMVNHFDIELPIT